jgi:small-conductance mechanosensitive channel
MKLTIDAKLDEIEQCLAEVNEMKFNEYRERICDHFYSLRNEVDIKRETVLENSHGNRTEEETDEINRLSANLIEQLDSTEEEINKNLRNEIERHTNGMINVEEHKRRLNKILRNIPLSKNDLKDLKADCETKINQIKSDLIQIDKRFNARLKENKFFEYSGKQERLLGEFLCNNFLTECRIGNHFCFFSKIKFNLGNKGLKGSCLCRSSN